jgi:hypothetical protein
MKSSDRSTMCLPQTRAASGKVGRRTQVFFSAATSLGTNRISVPVSGRIPDCPAGYRISGLCLAGLIIFLVFLQIRPKSWVFKIIYLIFYQKYSCKAKVSSQISGTRPLPDIRPDIGYRYPVPYIPKHHCYQ